MARQTDGHNEPIGTFRHYTNARTKHFPRSDGPDQLWGQLSCGSGEGYCAGNAEGAAMELTAQLLPKVRIRGAITPFPERRCAVLSTQ